MSDTTVQRNVDRGIALRASIAAQEKELKLIDAALESAALEGEQQPLEDGDREGKQYLAHGSEMIVPVILESDLVKKSVPEGGEMHRAITTALGAEFADKLTELFKPVQSLEMRAKDGQAYRRQLRALLPAEVAAEVLVATLSRDKHGIPKSRVLVAWERAKKID